MKIGVPKEIKTNENRVAMTPAGVAALVREKEAFVAKKKGDRSSLAHKPRAAKGTCNDGPSISW